MPQLCFQPCRQTRVFFGIRRLPGMTGLQIVPTRRCSTRSHLPSPRETTSPGSLHREKDNASGLDWGTLQQLFWPQSPISSFGLWTLTRSSSGGRCQKRRRKNLQFGKGYFNRALTNSNYILDALKIEHVSEEILLMVWVYLLT